MESARTPEYPADESAVRQRPVPLAYGDQTLPRDDTSRGNMGIFAVRLMGFWLSVWVALEVADGLIFTAKEWWDGTGSTFEPAWFIMYSVNLAAGVSLIAFAGPVVRFLRISAPWPVTPAVTPLAAVVVAVMGLNFLVSGLVSGASLLMLILDEREAFVGGGTVIYTPYPSSQPYQIPWAQIVVTFGEALCGFLLILLCRRMARWLRLEAMESRGQG